MTKWDKLNKEFDIALDSMTTSDWNKIKNKTKPLNQNKMKEIALRTDNDYFIIEVIDYPQIGWVIFYKEHKYHIDSIEIHTDYCGGIIYNVCLLL